MGIIKINAHQQHLTHVQLAKYQPLLILVLVQAVHHLTPVTPVNVQTIISQLILQQDVVLQHRPIVLQELFLQHLIHVLVILQAVLTLIQAILVHVQAEVIVPIQRKQDALLQHVHA